MSLNLDTRCTEHFASELAKGLADANVQYGRFVDPSWMWVGERIARILPQTPKSRAAAGLSEISNLAVSFFLLDQMKEMLASNPGTTEETPTKLSDFADLVAVAGVLTERLLTLPWDYEVLLETPLIAANAHELPLSPRYFLKSFGETDVTEFPLHPVDGMAQHMFRQRFPKALSTDHYYLGGRITGYLHTVEPIPELEELLDVTKGTLGLALVANVLKLETLRYNSTSYTVPFIVYRIVQGERRLLPYVWLSAEEATLLRRLVRPAGTRTAVVPAAIAAIQAAFPHGPTRGAARWYLDSFAGANGLLQIVQATVALEILLGDSKQANEIGVTSLLANRLAFMIARTPTERDAVLAHFRELYDVRSDIVHEGKAALGDKEYATLSALREYARRAIVTQLEQIWFEKGKLSSPVATSG